VGPGPRTGAAAWSARKRQRSSKRLGFGGGATEKKFLVVFYCRASSATPKAARRGKLWGPVPILWGGRRGRHRTTGIGWRPPAFNHAQVPLQSSPRWPVGWGAVSTFAGRIPGKKGKIMFGARFPPRAKNGGGTGQWGWGFIRGVVTKIFHRGWGAAERQRELYFLRAGFENLHRLGDHGGQRFFPGGGPGHFIFPGELPNAALLPGGAIQPKFFPLMGRPAPGLRQAGSSSAFRPRGNPAALPAVETWLRKTGGAE